MPTAMCAGSDFISFHYKHYDTSLQLTYTDFSSDFIRIFYTPGSKTIVAFSNVSTKLACCDWLENSVQVHHCTLIKSTSCRDESSFVTEGEVID